MYTLLSGLWHHLSRRDEYYVLLIGLDDAGKTTILEKLKALANPRYNPLPREKITTTVGMNVGRADVGRARLVMWDLGGQLELQQLWEKYYPEAHGVIFVIDSCAPDRLKDASEAFLHMVRHKATAGSPLLVLCNKQDQEGAMPVAAIKAELNQHAAALGHRDCRVLPVSAVSGVGLDAALDWISTAVARRVDRPPANADQW
eukprot:m.106752 g.106752  ORF g.106752 m.106752 type:complete len:202 (-) comp14235_c1_seq4:76-681(-)